MHTQKFRLLDWQILGIIQAVAGNLYVRMTTGHSRVARRELARTRRIDRVETLGFHAEAGRKRGRPRAKHSDKENYAQMSLYIRREVRNRTKARLFEKGMEFSALVESLLEGWLARQGR
jgi:hypothetical protein